MRNVKFVLVFILLLISISSCKKENDVNNYHYVAPLTYDDGIATASLNDVGMDTVPIVNMMNYLNNNSHAVHNILIIKDNKLVFEEYFEGYEMDMDAPGRNGPVMQYDKNTDHFEASVSKSVTSVIVGIAVKDGYLTDLNKRITEYFPEYSGILVGGKADITIHHLLTMASGLAWDESSYPYGDSRNDVTQILALDDPLGFILSKPLISTPGTQFHYSSGNTVLLAAIIEKVTGIDFLDYANDVLFNPLRSEGGVWISLHSGLTFASGGLYFKARELCKIGQLFLNEGQFEGKQIITTDWISTSQHEHIVSNGDIFPNTSYGYQWWITHFTVNGVSHKCFFAAGWGEQFMFIIPDLDMIIEFNSGNYEGSGTVLPFSLVNQYILKAIE